MVYLGNCGACDILGYWGVRIGIQVAGGANWIASAVGVSERGEIDVAEAVGGWVDVGGWQGEGEISMNER